MRSLLSKVNATIGEMDFGWTSGCIASLRSGFAYGKRNADVMPPKITGTIRYFLLLCI